MIKMWEKINEKFKKYPARLRVAEKMIELGLSLNEDGKIYCGNLKISDKALATAAEVDRRAQNYINYSATSFLPEHF